MRINVDDRILLVYGDLPQVFKLGDVRKRIKSPMPSPTMHVNLVRMAKAGLISRIRIPNKKSRRYHRNFRSLKEWFEVCVLKPLKEKKREEVIKV